MVSSVTGSNLLSYYQGQTALNMLSAANASSGSSSSASATNAALLNFLTGKEGIASFLEKRKPSWCSRKS